MAHTMTRKRTATSITNKQMQKACVLRIAYLLIYSEEFSDLCVVAKWFIHKIFNLEFLLEIIVENIISKQRFKR